MENAINIQVTPYVFSQIVQDHKDLFDNEKLEQQEVMILLSLLSPEIMKEKPKKRN